MVQPKAAQNTAENYLPHPVPNGHASKELSFVPQNSRTQLNSIIESPTNMSYQKQVEAEEPKFVFGNFFIEPQSEAEIAKPGEKKEEKIVITTSETDALYN